MAAVVQVGTGNIGSHLSMLLARIADIDTLSLVDPDSISAANVQAQNFAAGDIGRLKVEALGEALSKIRPRLALQLLSQRVQALPVGVLNCDLLVGCVDNLSTRLYLNQLAWRWGLVYLDLGVNAEHYLVRATLYDPGFAQAACLECAMTDAEYEEIEQQLPCQQELEVPSTGAPAHLGALAAAYGANFAAAVIHRRHQELINRQLLIEARHNRIHFTRYQKNPDCRFDHHSWVTLKTIPVNTVLDLLLGSEASLRIEGGGFLCRESCPACGQQGSGILYLAKRLGGKSCRRCGTAITATADSLRHRLRADSIPEDFLRLSLGQLGLVPGDVVLKECSDRQEVLLLAGEELAAERQKSTCTGGGHDR